MSLYVREIDWMWNDLHLSLAECRVYAYIYGLTHGAKGGYNGSKRHLAELLGLSKTKACSALDSLVEKNIIQCSNGIWRSVLLRDSQGVPSEDSSVPSEDKSVPSEDSPQTPLYNNKNNSKRLEEMTDFEKFFSKFTPFQQGNRSAATELLWDHRSPAAQQAMLDEVEGATEHSVDKNPYFFVQNFTEPKPVFLRGDEPGDLVQVKYGDRIKICTRATMELFGLEWVRDWNS